MNNVLPWLLGTVAGAGLAYHLQNRQTISQMQKSPQGYLELQERPQQYVLYSRLHQQPIAIHTLITHEKPQPPSTTDRKSNGQTQVQELFHAYGTDLIQSGKCDKVELIQGPIFSKGTPLKQQGQVVPNIYNMTIEMDVTGFYKASSFYDIVVCTNGRNHFFNAFVVSSKYKGIFKLLDRIVPLSEVEEKTGLTFGLQGASLVEIDFEGLKKERQLIAVTPQGSQTSD